MVSLNLRKAYLKYNNIQNKNLTPDKNLNVLNYIHFISPSIGSSNT